MTETRLTSPLHLTLAHPMAMENSPAGWKMDNLGPWFEISTDEKDDTVVRELMEFKLRLPAPYDSTQYHDVMSGEWITVKPVVGFVAQVRQHAYIKMANWTLSDGRVVRNARVEAVDRDEGAAVMWLVVTKVSREESSVTLRWMTADMHVEWMATQPDPWTATKKKKDGCEIV